MFVLADASGFDMWYNAGHALSNVLPEVAT